MWLPNPLLFYHWGEFFVQLFLKIFYSTASSGGFFLLKRYNEKKQPSDKLTLFFFFFLFCFTQKRQREYKYFLCRFLKVFRICCKLSIICPPFTVQIIIQPGFLLPVNIVNTAETMNINNIANANIFVESPVTTGFISELWETELSEILLSGLDSL